MSIPGNFSSGKLTDLLFYEPSAGTGAFWQTDGRGNVSQIVSYPTGVPPGKRFSLFKAASYSLGHPDPATFTPN